MFGVTISRKHRYQVYREYINLLAEVACFSALLLPGKHSTSARMLIYSLYMFYIPLRYNVKSVKNRTLVTQHSHLTSTEYDPNSAAAAEGG